MKLSVVNNFLLAAIIIVNGYVIAGPLLPEIGFWVHARDGKKAVQLQQKVASVATNPSENTPNSLVVPSMLLDQPILEGPEKSMYAILDKGIWRWPESSTPDKGGNTVLLGHRFTYTNPQGVLYFLNKVQTGDLIGITWNKKRLVYKVGSVRTVPPTDLSVVEPTERPTLTIYTCTPLWAPHNRLVVTAELAEKS